MKSRRSPSQLAHELRELALEATMGSQDPSADVAALLGAAFFDLIPVVHRDDCVERARELLEEARSAGQTQGDILFKTAYLLAGLAASKAGRRQPRTKPNTQREWVH